ncbi:uncharacterized protein LOC132715677 isoform X3 [Ruditapes philippinarum]|uniref:uncharacterized protein LOC132715677 isoform X3 n=1 Tax=Ruditapes philippinarum TaxID=129788 RepID=UPI00295AC7D9|nr:uncharacterized protein LOC132715677 isoform X3 [Ruditapes philippinarum]
MALRRWVFSPPRHKEKSSKESFEEYLVQRKDPPGFEVRQINKHIGKGVFSLTKIRAGSFLFEYGGELITDREGLRREKLYPLSLGSFLFFFNFGKKKLCIDGTFSEQIGRFANDGICEEKNAMAKTVLLSNEPRLALFATRNIFPGEEIRFDYGINDLPWRKKSQQTVKQRKKAIVKEYPVVAICDIINCSRCIKLEYQYMKTLMEMDLLKKQNTLLKLDGTELESDDDENSVNQKKRNYTSINTSISKSANLPASPIQNQSAVEKNDQMSTDSSSESKTNKVINNSEDVEIEKYCFINDIDNQTCFHTVECISKVGNSDEKLDGIPIETTNEYQTDILRIEQEENSKRENQNYFQATQWMHTLSSEVGNLEENMDGIQMKTTNECQTDILRTEQEENSKRENQTYFQATKWTKIISCEVRNSEEKINDIQTNTTNECQTDTLRTEQEENSKRENQNYFQATQWMQTLSREVGNSEEKLDIIQMKSTSECHTDILRTEQEENSKGENQNYFQATQWMQTLSSEVGNSEEKMDGIKMATTNECQTDILRTEQEENSKRENQNYFQAKQWMQTLSSGVGNSEEKMDDIQMKTTSECHTDILRIEQEENSKRENQNYFQATQWMQTFNSEVGNSEEKMDDIQMKTTSECHTDILNSGQEEKSKREMRQEKAVFESVETTNGKENLGHNLRVSNIMGKRHGNQNSQTFWKKRLLSGVSRMSSASNNLAEDFNPNRDEAASMPVATCSSTDNENPFTLTKETISDDYIVLYVHDKRMKTKSVDIATNNDKEALDQRLMNNEETPTFNPGSPGATKSPEVTSLSQTTNIENGSGGHDLRTRKSRKPSRPCPFCGKFRTKLTEHIKKKHKNEKDVQEAMSLPTQERNEKFSLFKKAGIFRENIKIMRNSDRTHSAKLIPERRHQQKQLVTCLSCKAFLSKEQFYKHKKLCNKFSCTRPSPNCVNSYHLAKSGNNEIKNLYASEIIDRFHDDEVGKICKNNEEIGKYGFKKFISYGVNNAKKDEKRKSTMSTMRQIARLYLEVKEYMKNHSLQNEISVKDMFTRRNMKYIKEVIHERKQVTTVDSQLFLGNSIKKFVRFLYDQMTNEGLDADAVEADRFLTSLRYNWSELFGESEYHVITKRIETRKPSALPNEKDLKLLTQYVKAQLKKLSEDSYTFIAEEEFTVLRNLLVTRLTLFNARRGGEPSRLTINQWLEAKNDVWKQNFNVDSLENSDDVDLMTNYKVSYQPGKNDGKLVPVMYPDDCHNALNILCNPDIRKDAGVSKNNAFLFPRTNHSERHCIGSDCIRSVCLKAGISSITATKVRHRAATLHASQDTTEHEKEAFFKHMGHSDKINKNVYQCPPAVTEVTKVGKFFRKLDEDLEKDIDDNSFHSLHELQTPSASTDRETSTLKEFLYKMADSYAVERVLENSTELITEEEVETVPEKLIGIKVTEANMNAARPLFTDDAWLVVKTSLDCLAKDLGKNHDEALIHQCKLQKSDVKDSERNIEIKFDNRSDNGMDIANTYLRETASDSEDLNEHNIQTSSCSAVRHSRVEEELSARKTLKNSRRDFKHGHHQTVNIRWHKRDSEMVTTYFSNCIYDVSRYDAKGALPGYKEIQKFIRIHPDVLSELSISERIWKIHTKINNERNKSRRLARKTMQEK